MLTEKEKRDNDELTESMGLIFYLMQRYECVSSVGLDIDEQNIRLTFIIAEKVNDDILSEFIKLLKESLTTYNHLLKKDVVLFNISSEYNENLTALDIVRDLITISSGELELIVSLFEEYFPETLVIENNDNRLDEDRVMQEAMIDKLLKLNQTHVLSKKLFAYRDEGMVHIFNK